MSRRALAAAAVLTAGAATGLAVARKQVAEREPGPDYTGSPYGAEASGRPQLGAAPNARMVPPAWEPPGLEALARWEPPPPRRPLTRTAGYVWAGPLTLVGLAVGALTGVRPRVREGVLLFAGAGGLPGLVLRSRGFTAGALGHVVIATREPDCALLAHELVHVRHAERLGPLTAPVYLGLLAVYGYARHPLERAARRGARRAVTDAA